MHKRGIQRWERERERERGGEIKCVCVCVCGREGASHMKTHVPYNGHGFESYLIYAMIYIPLGGVNTVMGPN